MRLSIDGASTALAIGLLSFAAFAEMNPSDAQPVRPVAEIIVLSTLHQYQPRVRNYGYADLSSIVEGLAPDVLALELSAEDIAERRPQRAKQEYPQSIFPLLDRRPFITIPLEPSGRLRAELGGKLVRSEQDFLRDAPEIAQAFEALEEQLFWSLLDRWRSACDVNSAETDALFAAKHRLQDAIAPREQAAAWEAWNQHFLRQIIQAAISHAGKRIVVVAGAEHGFWLRGHLKAQPNLKLLDTVEQLRPFACASNGSQQSPSVAQPRGRLTP